MLLMEFWLMIHVGVLKTKWWLQNRSISDFWKRVVDTTTSFPTNCAIALEWCWLWSFLSLGRKIFFLCDWKFVLDSLHPWERRVIQGLTFELTQQLFSHQSWNTVCMMLVVEFHNRWSHFLSLGWKVFCHFLACHFYWNFTWDSFYS